MTWKHTANGLLTKATGLTLTRAQPGSGVDGQTAAQPPADGTKRAQRESQGTGPGDNTSKVTRRERARKRAELRPPTDPKTDRLLSEPIFVIASLRSGSTLLRYLLNSHSQLHAPHELHVRRLSVHFDKEAARTAMKLVGNNQTDLEHLLWDRVLHRELVKSGKNWIVDKTPSNAYISKRIATAWPDARFIFLLRHPVSITQSWIEANVETMSPDEATDQILKYMRTVQRARETLDGLTVRYEDLTNDPSAQTARICEFLGIPWEAGMLNYGDQGVFTRGVGDWRDKIRSGAVQPGRPLPDAASVPAVLRDICQEWGYLPAEAAPPSEPDSP